MAKLMSAASPKGHDKVHVLLESGGPVLVEVRYPGGVVSSDWFLIDTEDEFDSLLVRLNDGAVMHVSRVWDLTNPAGAICLKRCGLLSHSTRLTFANCRSRRSHLLFQSFLDASA